MNSVLTRSFTTRRRVLLALKLLHFKNSQSHCLFYNPKQRTYPNTMNEMKLNSAVISFPTQRYVSTRFSWDMGYQQSCIQLCLMARRSLTSQSRKREISTLTSTITRSSLSSRSSKEMPQIKHFKISHFKSRHKVCSCIPQHQGRKRLSSFSVLQSCNVRHTS